MTLAPDPLFPGSQAPSAEPEDRRGSNAAATVTSEPATAPMVGSAPDGPLLDLADAAGTGLVRVDLEGRATALNPTGALLLEAIGGRDGDVAPEAITAALVAAALDGFPAMRDAAALTPES